MAKKYKLSDEEKEKARKVYEKMNEDQQKRLNSSSKSSNKSNNTSVGVRRINNNNNNSSSYRQTSNSILRLPTARVAYDDTAKAISNMLANLRDKREKKNKEDEKNDSNNISKRPLYEAVLKANDRETISNNNRETTSEDERRIISNDRINTNLPKYSASRLSDIRELREKLNKARVAKDEEIKLSEMPEITEEELAKYKEGRNSRLFIDNDNKKVSQNFKKGIENSLMQIPYYMENEMTANVPEYAKRRNLQYLTSNKVDDEEKMKYQSALKNRLFDSSGKNISNEYLKNTETNLISKGLEEKIDLNEQKINQNVDNINDPVLSKVAELAPSIGQMAVTSGASAINPVLGTTVFSLSASGGYVKDAKDRGMNRNDAVNYGTIMGIMEGVTEQLPIGKMLGAGKKIGKNMMKNALKEYGISIAENAIQEAIIEPISEVTATLTGGKETANWEGMGQRMLQSSINGALVAMVVSGANAGVGSAQNIYTKMTNGETITKKELSDTIKEIQDSNKVDIDKIIADSVTEQISNNQTENNLLPTARNVVSSNVSNNNSNNLKEEARNIIENSKVSETEKSQMLEVLDGMEEVKNADIEAIRQTVNIAKKVDIENNMLDTKGNYQNDATRRQKYIQYKNDTSDYDNTIVEQVLDTYQTNKNGKRTVKQWMKIAQDIGTNIADKSNAEIERIAYKSWFDVEPSKNITQYDSQTKQNVSFQRLTSDEWINEINRAVNETRQQNNETNIVLENQESNNTLPIKNEEYSYINQAFEQSAKKNNIDTNNETIKAIKRVTQERGIKTTFDADAFNDTSTNAIWKNNTDGTREVILNPNADTNKTLQNVITHELTHDLEGTNEYNELKDLILSYNKNKTDYSEARKSLEEIYSRVYDRNSTEFQSLIDNEIVADILGNKLGDQDFINNLTTEKPSLGRRIYNWVVDKLNKINKLSGYKNEKLFWTDVKNKFEKAYSQDYQENNVSEKSRFSINSNFKQEYDNWNKVDRQGSFLIGRTSEALKSIGLSDYDIVMDKSKILKIKNDHPEMSDDIIKSIPEILENPTLILNSQSNNKKAQGRKIIFGEILDTKGNPVLVALELNPSENKNNIDKIYKVASAYGKENLSTIQKWINNEENILYIDKQKNRTMNWLNGLGLQLPVPDNSSSSNNSITSSNENVNTTQYSMQESENNSGSFSVQDNQGKKLSKRQQERYKNVSSKLKDENGNLKRYYHGTQRSDRVGNYFDPERATSGPMAFFTDNQDIAKNYSENKQDTSISREANTEYDLFKVNGKNLDDYWNSLSKEQQSKIAQEGYNIGLDEDFENIVHEKGASKNSFSTQYDYYLNHEEKGNAIKALYDVFIQDGNLMFEDMVKFQDVLKYAGVQNVEYLDQYTTSPKVYEVYLNITNPFDTSEISSDIVQKLRNKARTIDNEILGYSADQWDKSNITPEQWIARLEDDIKNGTTHAWTSIPDWVTDVLKENGYDGIVDTGGKNGGEEHQVVIPFYSNQIKNVDNTNPTDNSDIRYSQNNNNWQSFLDQNYKNEGEGQTIQEVKVQSRRTLNPTEIANLKPEDASTTPKLQERTYEKGNKQSSFFSNITEKSKFLNEDFRDAMKQDENIAYYKTVSNKETLEKAYNKLQEDGQEEVMRWHSKDSKKATSEDVAEGWILLKQYQDAGDYDSAVEVAKKMRDIGTTAGQTVQAYNILSRLTPEGMFYYAQGELSEAYSKMVEGKSKKWIDENKGNFDLTPEETQFILDTMQDVSKMEDGYQRKVKLAEIQKVITDKIPATTGQSIKAWMRISMLFNPKTQVRNVMGNAVITPVNMFSDSVSAGIDRLISKKTGIRTTGNLKIKSYGKGFGKGLYESYNDFKKGINTRNIEGNRFEVSEGRSFNNKGLGKALNRVDNLLSFMLDAGDRGFYEATFTNSINNQLVLNKTNEVTQDMIDIATSEALQRTWQDNNNYTKAVLGIRKILNNVNVKGYGLGDVLIPFAKTPANLTKAIVDYSPVGLVKTLGSDAIKLKNSLENGQYTPQLQHKFVQDLGKATAGTFLYVLGYALAQAGVITGEADEDKDVKNFMKNSLGINSYSIKIGNKSFSYDWAQPIATPFAIMANYVKYSNDNPDASAIDKAINAMNIGTEQLLEQSFMESLNTVLNGSGTTLENLSQAVLELPSRAIPTFSKQIADMVDVTQRTSFEYDKPIQSAINSIVAKIPGASKTLAPSVDTLGNEIKKYGGDNNFFNVFINPANMNKGELSKAGEEIYNLYKETGDTTIFPRTAPYYINDKNDIK